MTDRANRQASRENRTNEASRTRRAGASTRTKATPFPVWKALIALALIVLVVLGAQFCAAAATIKVSVNGAEYAIHGAKTMQTAIKESGIPINPGDYISLRGQILERHGGHPFYATVNEVETVDPNFRLHDGDVVVVSDGKDILEDYDSEYEPIDYTSVTNGSGPLHVFQDGAEGTMEIRTGKVTGEQVKKWKDDPVDITRTCYSPNVGDDKVIALTFDDGPSLDCTDEILDILKGSNAKATFFWVGSRIDGDVLKAVVRKAASDGHQLCTHTYSYDDSDANFDYSTLPTDTQISEIVDGYKAIADTIGVEPSHAVRLPGGMMNNVAMFNVQPYIDAEIGWTVDTEDNKGATVNAIYSRLIEAQPGDIIILHDTASNAATVKALREAIPYMTEQGYRFITIDELLAYPAQEQKKE